MASFSSVSIGFVTDKRVTFGGVKTKAYVCWQNLINKCYNKNHPRYAENGGLGVVICDEWKVYSVFEKWFDENYFDGCTIDKDLAGGKLYSPSTCVMITLGDNVAERNTRYSGAKHPKSNDSLFYSTKPTSRGNFKIVCSRQEWDFNDFEEIKTQEKTSSGAFKYVYIAKEVI